MRMRDFGRRGADARVDAGGTRAGHGGSAAPSMTGGREDRGWRGHGGNAGVDGGQPRQNRAPTIMWTSTLCSYRVVKIVLDLFSDEPYVAATAVLRIMHGVC